MKFILNDYYTNDKSQLLKLHLLPLMMTLELQDILFFVRSLKQSALSCSSFSISQHISFSSNATRSGSHSKLVQPFVKTNRFKNFYFNRLLECTSPNWLAIKLRINQAYWLILELICLKLWQRQFIPLLLSCCRCSLPVSKSTFIWTIPNLTLQYHCNLFKMYVCISHCVIVCCVSFLFVQAATPLCSSPSAL